MNHDLIIKAIKDHKTIERINRYDLGDVSITICKNDFSLTDESKVKILNIVSQEINEDLKSHGIY